MTQYRLLERSVDTLKDTDEFWDEMKKQWSVIPCYLIGRPFLATIPYRRAIPEPEPVKQESTIDPGDGYRLVQDDEIVLPTDERIFVNVKGCSWDVCTQHTKLREAVLLGTMTYKQIKEFSGAWAFLVFRRRMTKKIILKEWLCWDDSYPDAIMLRWSTGHPVSERSNIRKWDNAIPTGQEREIEVPV